MTRFFFPIISYYKESSSLDNFDLQNFDMFDNTDSRASFKKKSILVLANYTYGHGNTPYPYIAS